MGSKENEHWLSITDFDEFSNQEILFDLMEYFFPVTMNIQKNGTGFQKESSNSAFLSNWQYIDYTITLSNIFTGNSAQFDYKTGTGISLLESNRVFETFFSDLNMGFLKSAHQLASELGIEYEHAKSTFQQLRANNKKQKTVYGIKDFSILSASSSSESALHCICLKRLNAKIKPNQSAPKLQEPNSSQNTPQFDDENVFKQRAKVLVLYCFCDLNIPDVSTQLEKQLTLYKKMVPEEQFTQEIFFFKQINEKAYDDDYAKIKVEQLAALECKQDLNTQTPLVKEKKAKKSL